MHNLRRECSWLKNIFLLLALFGASQSGWAQGQSLTFSVTADIPYGTKEISTLQKQITNHNKFSPSLLLMHLGDIMAGDESCNQTRYALIATELKRLAVPAFIVPGDNETNDCSNPVQGFNYWQQHFSDFEQYFCGAPLVEHQNVRHENIAFIMDGVLFVGLNLVAGTVVNTNDWNARLRDNGNWVDEQFKAKVSQVRAAVVFAHAGPASDRALFFDPFVQSAAAFKKPVLYLHGSDHAWKQDNPWSTANTMRVVVDNGSAADPVAVTVTMNMSKPSTAFTFNRKPWSSQTIVNMPPCANAGPDQSITGMSTSLLGNATDDGDPNNSLTTIWSKVSGPGTVTFENANALATTASFSANGIYILSLTADDGQLQKTEEVTIGVNTSIAQLPIVISFTPTNGTTGTAVTITGSKFTGATGVAFNGTSAGFTVNSDTQISTTVPTGAITGKITVTNSVGTGISADDFVVTTSTSQLPIVSSFTPTSGATGTTVTITGSNFTGATSVTFNGTPAGFTVNSDAQISTMAPAGVTTGKIAVTNSFGTGFTVNNFVVNTDAVTSLIFNPTDDAFVWSRGVTTNYGAVKELRIEANSASDVSNIYFKFNVSGISGLVQSAKLRLAVTDGTDNGGSIFSVANDYAGMSTPWVETGLIWNNAPAITGSALSSLGSVSSGQKVDFDVTAAITGNGVYSFAIKTSSSNSGLYYSKEGNTKPELILQVEPPSVQPPAITAFTPVKGPVATAVTITGSHFNGTTTVAFNGTPASFTVDSDTQIRATVPAGATSGKISVTNADGTAFSATNFSVISPPAIASFTSVSAPVGAEVTITGSNFTTATSVSFNSTPASFIIDSDTQIRVTVPVGATNGKISVTNAAGTGLSQADFIVLTSPAIAAFTPTSGPGGTEVTITGSAFAGTSNVTFNGITAASIVVDSDSTIRATVPVGATLGTGKIVVTNSVGSATSAADFTITPAPITSSFTPKHDTFVKPSEPTLISGTANTLRAKTSANEVFNSYLKFEVIGLNGTPLNAKLRLHVSDAGPDGGTIYLVSNNFKSSTTPWGESGLHWNNAPPLPPFGGAALSSIGAVSLGQWVEFDVTAAIVGNGTYSFGLKNNNGDQVYYRSKEFGAATSPQLVIQSVASNAPSIASFAPADGPVGTMVTITGNNFTGTKSATFSGKVASFTLDSNTQLRATVPVGAAIGKIRITNANGTASYAQNFIVTVQPVMTSFTPSSGVAGTQVTINGSYFNGTSSVTINGKAATTFYLESAAKIRANVPAGATVGKGKIVVTNSAGSATSTGDFTVNRLLSFTPQHDTYVRSTEPALNFGTAGMLRGRLGPIEVLHSYLKFNVTGVNGTILNAKLRLQVADASPNGGSVHLVSNNYVNTTTPWIETGLTWANAPGIASAALSSKSAVSIGQWVEFDVTAAIVGNGIYSFGLKSDNADAVYYRAKENGTATLPKLVIQIAASSGGAAKRADSTASQEENVSATIPKEFMLEQNYPNPFNPNTTIRVGLPEASHVTIKVYTINGAEVETLVDGQYPAGTHAIMFHAENLSSGTYFYIMQASEVRLVRRLLLVK